jgi:hypothetical protein
VDAISLVTATTPDRGEPLAVPRDGGPSGPWRIRHFSGQRVETADGLDRGWDWGAWANAWRDQEGTPGHQHNFLVPYEQVEF